MQQITLHAVPTPSTDSVMHLIEDLTIDTTADLQLELILYRYDIHTLPKHIIEAYQKPIVETYTLGGYQIRDKFAPIPSRVSLGKRAKAWFHKKQQQ